MSAPLDYTDELDGFKTHYDGPYDALRPVRNRGRAASDAPLKAFAPDGPNNSVTIAQVEEDDKKFENEVPEVGMTDDWQATKSPPPQGRETEGLGTDTYMDGIPASPRAQQEFRKDELLSAEHDDGESEGLLGRVRSLRRNISNASRRSNKAYDEKE